MMNDTQYQAISYYSRIPPVENGLFCDWIFFYWILLVLLIVSRVDFRFYSFCALPWGDWCEGASCWQLSVLRAFSASNGSTNPSPSELVALDLAESRQSYGRRVTLRREPPKLQQAQPLLAAWDRYRALLPSCDTRCWRAELCATLTCCEKQQQW